jgi:hypothetical protein
LWRRPRPKLGYGAKERGRERERRVLPAGWKNEIETNFGWIAS